MDEPRRDPASPGEPARNTGTAPPPASSLDSRVASLAAALRRARIENAEHSSALADVRGAEIARLEILREALEPVLVQIPKDCDIFDVAVSPGERPRLFIDQIGFIEMGDDKRSYRFLQDTRHGRITIGESDKIDNVVEAVTTYIAHRLIEREKALAVDYASGGAAGASAAKAATRRPVAKAQPARGGNMPGKLFSAYLFAAEFLGSAVFFGLLGLLGIWVYKTYLQK